MLILSWQPDDWVKQSMPFSYVSLTAESLDGAAHAVQVYSELTAGAWRHHLTPLHLSLMFPDWLSSVNRSQVVVWSTAANNDVVYLKAQLQTPAVFNELYNRPEWGTLYHAMKSVSGIGLTCHFPFMVGDIGWPCYVQDSRGGYCSKSFHS